MNLTTDILDDIWDIVDLVQTVTLRRFDPAADDYEETGVAVLALKRTQGLEEEPVGDDETDAVRRRRWHLRAKDAEGAAIDPPPKPTDAIEAFEGLTARTWKIVSVTSAAHNTRFVCETVRGW